MAKGRETDPGETPAEDENESGAATPATPATGTASPTPGSSPDTAKNAADAPITVRPKVERPRGMLVVVIAAIVIIGAVAVAAVGAWPRLADRLEARVLARLDRDRPIAVALAPIKAEVATLKDRLAELAGAERPSDPRVAALATRLDALDARLAATEATAGAIATLTRRVAALEARPSASPSPAAPSGATVADETLARFDQRLGDLDQRLAGLETALDDRPTAAAFTALRARVASLDDRLAALDARLGAVEKSAGSAADGGAALLLAVGQLRQALAASAPFAPALDAVRRLAGDDPEIATPLAELDALAGDGVATVESLAARFSTLADAIVAATLAPADDGWIARTVARLGRLITLRRVGEVAGDDVEARVARAETRLAARDLAGAVAEIAALDGPPAKVAADWLADARARLAADRALAAIETRALDALGRAPA